MTLWEFLASLSLKAQFWVGFGVGFCVGVGICGFACVVLIGLFYKNSSKKDSSYANLLESSTKLLQAKDNEIERLHKEILGLKLEVASKQK